MEKKEIIQITFNILLVIAICFMLFTIITLLKNKELITTDPLVYGMKIHNFTYCSCFDDKGSNWVSEGGTFTTKRYEGYSYLH